MQVGCLGELIFSVSDEMVQTISNVQWSGSARYGVHQRHLTDALTEFCGIDPDKLSFDILLSAYLGVEPQQELARLWQYERKGEALSLVIGDKAYGKYRWNIISHKIKLKRFDGSGRLLAAEVAVSLQEFLKI